MTRASADDVAAGLAGLAAGQQRAKLESELAEEVAAFTDDPLGFVRFAFPWGEAGGEAGGDLEHSPGPRAWQVRLLEEIGAKLRNGWCDAHGAIQLARASGHGIGKSACVAWLILWSLTTHEDARAVVTANTESQLRSKTWAELAKWHRLCLCGHWFRYEATSLHSQQREHKTTWRADAHLWSEQRPEAFAGLHNQGRRILLIFDEASAIPDVIWETAEGALTDADTEMIWCVFGNPTRNTGRFRECFGRMRHRWDHEQIDSREVEGVDRGKIDQWVEDYGEDSDFCRIRVRGVFPRAGSMQLIGSDLIEEAAKREATSHQHDPVIIGVDVARFGDDQSVICIRRGADARTVDWVRLRGVDTMDLAGRVAALIEQHQADGCFVDETGVGAGVVDRLQQLGYSVIGVNFGNKPDVINVGDDLVANKAAECWCRMRDWMKWGAIPADVDLQSELEGREYAYDLKNRIRLEKKDDLKKRGLPSPDNADALALTFAYPVGSRNPHMPGMGSQSVGQAETDYDPFG